MNPHSQQGTLGLRSGNVHRYFAQEATEIVTNSEKFLSSEQESTWLIMGGSGFIGRWIVGTALVSRSLGLGPKRIVVLTRNVEGAKTKIRAFLGHKIDLSHLDVLDYSEILNQLTSGQIQDQPLLVFHCGTSTQASASHSSSVMDTIRTLANINQGHPPRVVHLSSGAVYVNAKTDVRCLPEDEETRSIDVEQDPYTRTKLTTESEISQLTTERRLLGANPRLFTFAGPGLESYGYYAVTEFVSRAIQGEKIIIQGNPSNLRSYMYPTDLVEWLFSTAQSLKSSHLPCLNIGSEAAVTVEQLAETVNSIFHGTGIEIHSSITQPRVNYVPSTKKTRDLLGTAIRIDLEKSLLRWKRSLDR